MDSKTDYKALMNEQYGEEDEFLFEDEVGNRDDGDEDEEFEEEEYDEDH